MGASRASIARRDGAEGQGPHAFMRQLAPPSPTAGTCDAGAFGATRRLGVREVAGCEESHEAQPTFV